jgi:hypothetical protein
MAAVIQVYSRMFAMTDWSRALFEKLPVVQLLKRIYQYFVEPEVSLPRSREFFTGP